MTTELQTTDYRQTFQAIAAERFHAAADMTLHELVDEFQRLSVVVAANLTTDENGYIRPNDAGKVAQRERNIVLGAARARFGIAFEPYDSSEPGSESGF